MRERKMELLIRIMELLMLIKKCDAFAPLSDLKAPLEIVAMEQNERDFQIGTFYDARTGTIVHNGQLNFWSDKEQKNMQVRSTPMLATDIQMSDSFEDRLKKFDADLELAVTLFGFVQISGSAGVAFDFRKSSRTFQIDLQMHATGYSKQVGMENLLNFNNGSQIKSIVQQATHVVTKIVYGAQETVSISLTSSNDSSHVAVHGSLAAKIPIDGLNIEGSINGSLGGDRTLLEYEVSVKIYGDANVNPMSAISYEAGIELYKNLPSSLNKSGVFKPVRVYLIPISWMLTDDIYTMAFQRVAKTLLDQALDRLFHFEKLEYGTGQDFIELKDSYLYKGMSSFANLVDEFCLSVSIQSAEFRKKITKIIKDMRSKDSSDPTELIKAMESPSAPYSLDNLDEYIFNKKREAAALNEFYKWEEVEAKGKRELSVLQAKTYITHIIVLVLRLLPSSEKFSACLRNLPVESDPHCMEEVSRPESWLDATSNGSDVRGVLWNFLGLVQGDFAFKQQDNRAVHPSSPQRKSDSTPQKQIVPKFAILDETVEEGFEIQAQIRIYEGFKITEHDLNPPAVKSIRIVEENGANMRVFYEIEGNQSFLIGVYLRYYTVNGTFIAYKSFLIDKKVINGSVVLKQNRNKRYDIMIIPKTTFGHGVPGRITNMVDEDRVTILSGPKLAKYSTPLTVIQISNMKAHLLMVKDLYIQRQYEMKSDDKRDIGENYDNLQELVVELLKPDTSDASNKPKYDVKDTGKPLEIGKQEDLNTFVDDEDMVCREIQTEGAAVEVGKNMTEKGSVVVTYRQVLYCYSPSSKAGIIIPHSRFIENVTPDKLTMSPIHVIRVQKMILAVFYYCIKTTIKKLNGTLFIYKPTLILNNVVLKDTSPEAAPDTKTEVLIQGPIDFAMVELDMDMPTIFLALKVTSIAGMPQIMYQKCSLGSSENYACTKITTLAGDTIAPLTDDAQIPMEGTSLFGLAMTAFGPRRVDLFWISYNRHLQHTSITIRDDDSTVNKPEQFEDLQGQYDSTPMPVVIQEKAQIDVYLRNVRGELVIFHYPVTDYNF